MKSILTSIIVFAAFLVSFENSSPTLESDDSCKKIKAEKRAFKKDKWVLNSKVFE
jgi:hypothetical protein